MFNESVSLPFFLSSVLDGPLRVTNVG